MKIIAVLTVALAIMAGAFYLKKHHSTTSSDQISRTGNTSASAQNSDNDSLPTQDSSGVKPSVSPDYSNNDNETDTTVSSANDLVAKDTFVAPGTSDTINTAQAQIQQDKTDVLNLGNQPLSESSFRYWVGRLRNDPALLQLALTEYLENSDMVRARHLAAVLAEINSPPVVDAAVQLAHSSETDSQLTGLELLSKLQPSNIHARNAALDLLATQDNPALLAATLNVFATPPQAVSADQRQLLIDQAQLLSSHSDANVRALSISTITNWSSGSSYQAASQAATMGLSDSNEAVRAKSAASLIGAQSPSAETKAGLLSMAANKQEPKSSRQLALYALSKMPLTEAEKNRYEALEIEVRRTR